MTVYNALFLKKDMLHLKNKFDLGFRTDGPELGMGRVRAGRNSPLSSSKQREATTINSDDRGIKKCMQIANICR